MSAHDPLWREDAAICEIVSGELAAQRYEPLAEAGSEALAERAGLLGLRAREMVTDGDLDAAGHALIGCSVTLGLAALASEASEQMSVETFAVELAETVTWNAEQPSPKDLMILTDQIAAAADPGVDGPRLWELALRAGAGAAGLSAYITRRSPTRTSPPA